MRGWNSLECHILYVIKRRCIHLTTIIHIYMLMMMATATTTTTSKTKNNFTKPRQKNMHQHKNRIKLNKWQDSRGNCLPPAILHSVCLKLIARIKQAKQYIRYTYWAHHKRKRCNRLQHSYLEIVFALCALLVVLCCLDNAFLFASCGVFFSLSLSRSLFILVVVVDGWCWPVAEKLFLLFSWSYSNSTTTTLGPFMVFTLFRLHCQTSA